MLKIGSANISIHALMNDFHLSLASKPPRASPVTREAEASAEKIPKFSAKVQL
jgi:hypothetical protein